MFRSSLPGRTFLLHHFPALRAGPGVWPFFQALAPIFSGGGFEYQIQGGGLNGEGLQGLGIFLTLFAQQADDIE